MRRFVILALVALVPLVATRAQTSPLDPSRLPAGAATPEDAVSTYVRALAERDGEALMAAADSGAVHRFLRLLARPDAQRALPDSLRGRSGAALLTSLLRSTNGEMTATLVGEIGWIDPDSLGIDVLGSVPDGPDRAFVVARVRGRSRAVITNTPLPDLWNTGAAAPRLFAARRRADGVWMADVPPLVYRMLAQSDTAPGVSDPDRE